MSIKQYSMAAEKLNEIGRMLSGWMGKKQTEQEKLL